MNRASAWEVGQSDDNGQVSSARKSQSVGRSPAGGAGQNGTAEAVYAHFGLPFGGAAADAMRALGTGSRAPGAHRYTLDEFGLTQEQVAERFGPAIIAG